jgi:camphor 5-monooxygenase
MVEDVVSDINGAASVPAHVPTDRIRDVNIYALPGQEQDFHAAWKKLQDGSPDLIWTPQNEGHWIAMRGDVLAEVQSDHERFSSSVIVLPKSVGEQHKLIPTTTDPPEHRPYRLLLNARLAPSAIRGLQEHLRSTAAEMIDGFAHKGRCDFTAEYAEIFPIRIFMGIVGLPMSDAPKIKLWAESMTRPEPVMPFAEARQAFFDHVGPIIAARRADPGDDLISHIITADMNGRQLNNDEALSLVTQVLIAGVDTVVNFLSFVMLYLAKVPEARRELAADPAKIMPGVHELFRRFGLVVIARTVRNDIIYRGVALKAGDMVCIPTQVHGLDETINPDPMRVDFARPRARHSAFGSGPHMCPGQELARAEVAITISEWLKRIPDFRVAADADTKISGGIVAQVNQLVLEWEIDQ